MMTDIPVYTGQIFINQDATGVAELLKEKDKYENQKQELEKT